MSHDQKAAGRFMAKVAEAYNVTPAEPMVDTKTPGRSFRASLGAASTSMLPPQWSMRRLTAHKNGR